MSEPQMFIRDKRKYIYRIYRLEVTETSTINQLIKKIISRLIVKENNNLCVCVHAGVLVVYSMRWLQVGHCSPAPPWRTSSTSSSGYWVSDSRPDHHSNPTFHCTHAVTCLTLNKVKYCICERLWLCDFRHTHRGELAGNLLHRRI